MDLGGVDWNQLMQELRAWDDLRIAAKAVSVA